MVIFLYSGVSGYFFDVHVLLGVDEGSTWSPNISTRKRVCGVSKQRIDKIDLSQYQIIHFAGGHGAMWGFPNNKGIARIAATIYENGGIVSAVCHGSAALVNIKLSSGKCLIYGKDVSAFTGAEEAEAGMTNVVPFLLESTLRERGARMHPAKNWQDQSIVSERLVTGQNPQSGHSVALSGISSR